MLKILKMSCFFYDGSEELQLDIVVYGNLGLSGPTRFICWFEYYYGCLCLNIFGLEHL